MHVTRLELMVPEEGHGDAWFRQGRRCERRETRNAVPPRKSERQPDNWHKFLRPRCLVSERPPGLPSAGRVRAITAEVRSADRPVGGLKISGLGEPRACRCALGFPRTKNADSFSEKRSDQRPWTGSSTLPHLHSATVASRGIAEPTESWARP